MATNSKKASKKVGKVMHELKAGTLRSGNSGKKVTSRKQAIAIGLSEARREGAKVTKPPAEGRSGGPRSSTTKRSTSTSRTARTRRRAASSE